MFLNKMCKNICRELSMMCLLVFTAFFPITLKGEKCPEKELVGYTQQVQFYIQRHETERSLRYSDSVIQVLKNPLKMECKAALSFLIERGEVLEINKRFAEALDLYYHVIRTSESKSWWSLSATAHIAAARCFEVFDRPDDCIRHFEMAKKIIEQYKLFDIYANYCLRYASFHRIYGNLDSAIVYSKKSVYYGQKYKVQRSVFDGHLLLGLLVTDIDTSVYHLKEAIRMFEEREDFHGAAFQCINIANRLLKVGRLSEARNELEKTNYFLKQMEQNTRAYFSILSIKHEVQHQIFFKEGRLDSAYHYIQLAWSYDKKSEWHINQDSISKNAVNFAIEKEKQKNILLEKISKRTTWGLIAATSLLLVFLALLLNNYKKRKKIIRQNQLIYKQNSELEQANAKQSLLLSEVHHRVKNNLQLVISLLTLHGNASSTDKTNRFMNEITAKIRSISLIHEQLYSSGEFEDINVSTYLNQLTEHFRVLQKNEDNFEYSIDGGNNTVNLETIMPIGIVCSELIGNSLKYARLPQKKLQIHISVYKVDDKFVLKYSDNGPGLPEEDQSKNDKKMGLHLISNMVRQLQAECRFYNDNGAHFNLMFAEKKVSKI